jgi:hypothetical protein
MKLLLKEDPREWRKAAWFGMLGLAMMSTLMHWRRVLPGGLWFGSLAVCAASALVAWLCPRWFRGYYRCSGWLGFQVVQVVGRAVLTGVFFLVLTPLGLGVRLLGVDPLRLKRPAKASTYWTPSRESTPLERLF